MEECKTILDTGLRDVIVASTKISHVDGNAGKLIYRGYLAKELAENATFEEIAHLLLYEKLPDKNQLESFKKQLLAERHIPPELVTVMKTLPRDALPMDVLQACVSMLAAYDPDVKSPVSREGSLRMAVRLIAKLPIILAAYDRIRNGGEPLKPSTDLSHAANFLYLLNGTVPDAEVSRFFDVCLVLHAEHSFNASTFAAREVASTTAHIYAAVGAAAGSLSGGLHGGANTRVMNMLLKIGSPDAVEKYVNDELESGRKIMGLGHAVYNVDDPRALILAPMSKKMGERVGESKWYEISRTLEEKAKAAFKKRKNTDIFVNVDFYSASLYYYMGIAVDLFTPIFAISRIAGWTAHVIEEQFADAAPKPMLYRPESRYIGDYCGPDECSFTPIETR
jgi:citrate synthase